MKIGLFGGSFDPVHSQHVALAESAVKQLGLERLIVMPSAIAPHKRNGAAASGADRIEMCRIAFRGLCAEISAYEIERDGTSYSYLTCSHLKERHPNDEFYFLVGADMLENFPLWKKPEKILECVTLVAGGRGKQSVEKYAEIISKTFGKEVILLPFAGKDVSSTRIRVELAFGKCSEELSGEVYAYAKEKGIYTHPAIAPALALEKPERREHSFRVALMAAEHAAAAGVSREKAILAAALH
ncbi:MAG: nicotinate (nicotinamide) nucleotide adenylyltransferase, partial [Clostridia bacterium]|nr:nicotinate (nicotinamide) nucleotide adenylyltransferase [Clostridia bacterium]